MIQTTGPCPASVLPEGGAKRAQRRPGDLILGMALFLLLVAYAPSLNHAATSLRAVILWPLGGAGVLALVLLAVRGDRTARWACGLLTWALMSAITSDAPRTSLFSAYDPDLGFVYLACCFGMWALGLRRSRAGATVVMSFLLLGAVVNMFIALSQALLDGPGILGLKDGRADGLGGNPVFLGGLMAGVLVVAALSSATAVRCWGWLVLVAGALVVVNLSGSRIALLIGAVLSLGLVLAHNAKRTPALIAALLLGLLVSSALVDDSATARTDSSIAGGSSARTLMWRSGLEAVSERPVFGWGPGRFGPATAPRVTIDYVEAEGVDRYYADAHNRIVESLVTIGVPGTILLIGFGVSAARRSRGPLAWFAAAVLATTLFQPTSLVTLPAALLLLGYSAAGGEPDPPWRSPPCRWALWGISGVIGVAGLLVGIRLVIADHSLWAAVQERDLAAADRAHHLFPGDPGITEEWADVRFRAALVSGDPGEEREALAAARTAVAVDPSSGPARSRLGGAYRSFGPGPLATDLEVARRSYLEALERNPWSPRAMLGLWDIARQTNHPAEVAQWRRRLCRVGACPPAT